MEWCWIYWILKTCNCPYPCSWTTKHLISSGNLMYVKSFALFYKRISRLSKVSIHWNGNCDTPSIWWINATLGTYGYLLISVRIILFRFIYRIHPATSPHHDDVIIWKYFPRNWPFVRGIHRSPVNSPHKGQWRGASMFSLICTRINGWLNNDEAGDLRRHRAHYDVTEVFCSSSHVSWTRAAIDGTCPQTYSTVTTDLVISSGTVFSGTNWDWLTETETSIFNTTWHYTAPWCQPHVTFPMYYSILIWYQLLICMLGDLCLDHFWWLTQRPPWWDIMNNASYEKRWHHSKIIVFDKFSTILNKFHNRECLLQADNAVDPLQRDQ